VGIGTFAFKESIRIARTSNVTILEMLFVSAVILQQAAPLHAAGGLIIATVGRARLLQSTIGAPSKPPTFVVRPKTRTGPTCPLVRAYIGTCSHLRLMSGRDRQVASGSKALVVDLGRPAARVAAEYVQRGRGGCADRGRQRLMRPAGLPCLTWRPGRVSPARPGKRPLFWPQRI
jgi:hypothetical protein